MDQRQTTQQPISKSPLSHPGPHGYPMRFGVRLAGVKGFKIYGSDARQPFRYIEWHTRRQVLHESGHKKDKSPAIVTVHENWPSWSILPLDEDAAAFTITVHDRETGNLNTSSPDSGGDETADNGEDQARDQTIDMDHTRCRPVTFQFHLPITTTQADGTTDTTTETFEWRRAPQACQETRGIRKKTLPMMEAGDERLPEERFVYSASGSVLVRLGGKRCAPGKDRPLGYTRQGEEIVASYSDSRDYRAWYYFQFWGSGATGELGEGFTHVAVMSGLAVFQDEEEERGRRNRSASSDVQHGVSPSGMSAVVPRKADLPRYGSRFGFHHVQHKSEAPGHAAVQGGERT
jgi:hypothetical protein